MKKILAIVLAALSLACMPAAPALAQGEPSTQSTQNAAVAVSPAMQAAVKRMLDAMQFPTLMHNMFDQMLQSVPAMLRQAAQEQIKANPNLSERSKVGALADAEAEIPVAMATLTQVLSDQSMMDELIAEMTPLYARFYTVDEVDQLTALYRTPLGRKMLTTMPQLSAESMAINQRVLLPRVNAELKKILQAAKLPPQ